MNNDLKIQFLSDVSVADQFCKNAMLDSHRSAWKKRRKDGVLYANIRITSKGHDFGNSWTTWWEPFIGIECFARVVNKLINGKEVITEAFPVRLTQTLIHEGRGIPANAFSIA